MLKILYGIAILLILSGYISDMVLRSQYQKSMWGGPKPSKCAILITNVALISGLLLFLGVVITMTIGAPDVHRCAP